MSPTLPPEYHLGEARKQIGRATDVLEDPELVERLEEVEAVLQDVETAVREA